MTSRTPSRSAPRPELDRLMGWAIDEARLALRTGDVPVGAVVVGPDGAVVGRGHNGREATGDASRRRKRRPGARSEKAVAHV